MQVQQHCSEHFTGFQWRLGFNTKLLVSIFSVSIRTVCHRIFLTFIHTIPLGHCALLMPLCWKFLASLLRPLEKDLSLFLDTLSGVPTTIPQNNSVSQLLKRNLRQIFLKFICAEVQKCVVSVCVIQEGYVCACACVYVSPPPNFKGMGDVREASKWEKNWG